MKYTKYAIIALLVVSPVAAFAAHDGVDTTPNPAPQNFTSNGFDNHAEPSCSNGLDCASGGFAPRPAEWQEATQTCVHFGADCVLDLTPTQWYRDQMLATARQMIANGHANSFRNVALPVPAGSRYAGLTFGYWIDQVR